MQYRIVSIENPSEVHVHDGQLVVMRDKGTATVPLRDISIIVVCGPNIRISTMAQTVIATNRIAMLFLGRNHHPAMARKDLVPIRQWREKTWSQSATRPNPPLARDRRVGISRWTYH